MLSRIQKPSEHIGFAVLVAGTVVVLGPIVFMLGFGGIRAAFRGDLPPVRGLWLTLLVAVGIGVLATAMAWFPARAIGRSQLLSRMLLVPVLLPPYLIYSGYGMMRDPSWWLGRVLESFAADGHAWVTRWVGMGFAVIGLAAWAFPLATLVLALGFRQQGREIDDMLRLEAGGVRRFIARTRMLKRSIIAAVLVVALVMIGSAVPLHLAQIPTMAIELWRELAESPSTAWDGVWAASWPLMVVALVGAVVCARWIEQGSRESDQPATACAGVPRHICSVGWSVWVAASLVPFVVFLVSIRSSGSLAEFWTLSGAGVVAAIGYGAADAAVAMVLAISAAMLAGQSGGHVRWCSRVVLIAWVFVAAIPGVFVGGVLARLGSSVGWLGGDGLVVVAHVARFGAVAVIAGLLAGWSEPRSRREMRLLDDGGGLVGWCRACLPWQWPILVGAALTVGMLGVHEIEATVILLPPGRANLAAQILGYLHFSRTEELSAAAVYLIGSGIVVAGVISILLNRRNCAS